MTHDHSALLTQLDALKSADPGSVFAELIRAGLQALIDAEATASLGAGRYERTEERTTYRNGTRPKTVATTSGEAAFWVVLPESARTASADRPGVARGDHGGLRAWCLDPQRR